MITVENAIPVNVVPQIAFRDFLKERFDPTSDIYKGIQIGTFYCHYGELLKRRSGDPEVSNQLISDEDFEEKMSRLLQNVPDDIREFVHI